MITKLHQSIQHSPDSIGDCWRTCIACLLGLDSPERVPHFVQICNNGDSDHVDMAREWLYQFGLGLWNMNIIADDLDDVFQMIDVHNAGEVFLLSGGTNHDTNHSVIADKTGIIHDPNVSPIDINRPCTHGYFIIEAITAHIPSLEIDL